MIIGIGSDLTDIRRIQQSLDRFGDRFIDRIYTDVERAHAEAKSNRAASYAKRFAAKEACAKALGTGMGRGVFWTDMGVANRPSGRPTLVLTGGAAARLKRMIPQGFRPVIHLSLTDEEPYAQAFVVIEAAPETPEAAARRLAEGALNV